MTTSVQRKNAQEAVAQIQSNLTDVEEFRNQLNHFTREQLYVSSTATSGYSSSRWLHFSDQLNSTMPVSTEEQEAQMQLKTRVTAIKDMLKSWGLHKTVPVVGSANRSCFAF